MTSQVSKTTRWPPASARASALAASGCATPWEGAVLDAYPAMRTGDLGVVSTRATPAFQPGGGSSAFSAPGTRSAAARETSVLTVPVIAEPLKGIPRCDPRDPHRRRGRAVLP